MEKTLKVEDIIFTILKNLEINNIQWETIKTLIDSKYSIEKNEVLLK